MEPFTRRGAGSCSHRIRERRLVLLVVAQRGSQESGPFPPRSPPGQILGHYLNESVSPMSLDTWEIELSRLPHWMPRLLAATHWW